MLYYYTWYSIKKTAANTKHSGVAQHLIDYW